MGNMASPLCALDDSASTTFYGADQTGTIIANAREDGREGCTCRGEVMSRLLRGEGLPTTKLIVDLFNGNFVMTKNMSSQLRTDVLL